MDDAKDSERLREACAVFGVSLFPENDYAEAAGITYNALLAMQHRGQEGAGIAVSHGHTISMHKDVGLVDDVFPSDVLLGLPRGKVGVGHARYSTTGSNTIQNVQPFVTEFLTGRIATVHNGNVINAREIREKLMPFGLDFSATSDTEVISQLIAYRVMKARDLAEGAAAAAKILKGAFSLIVMSGDGKLVALRDPYGFRPLCIGENDSGMAVASETCALDSCGFRFVRDVRPGELVLIENGKITRTLIYARVPRTSLCVFEYIYFARPDSVIDGLSVFEARRNMGKVLAREHPVEADIVCGVPDSGMEASMGYAEESGIRYASAFVKNRYIGRSFIYPSQAQRENAVRLKLNPLSASVRGKRVVLVDDSIVRGTTSPQVIAALRGAGAKEIHLRISSPPFRHTCYFGTDIGDEENLIANRCTVEEIRKYIGADSLGYISVEGLLEACAGCGEALCTGCFTGEYASPTNAAPKNGMEERIGAENV